MVLLRGIPHCVSCLLRCLLRFAVLYLVVDAGRCLLVRFLIVLVEVK